MRVGVVVPQGWVMEYRGWDPVAAWERTVGVTRQAEALGAFGRVRSLLALT